MRKLLSISAIFVLLTSGLVSAAPYSCGSYGAGTYNADSYGLADCTTTSTGGSGGTGTTTDDTDNDDGNGHPKPIDKPDIDDNDEDLQSGDSLEVWLQRLFYAGLILAGLIWFILAKRRHREKEELPPPDIYV